jgi:hypothetical protein
MQKIFVPIVIFLFVVLSSGCAQKYAVLVSANEVTYDDISYHSVWWYDLFIQYKMLVENGFEEDKIYVLYGSGTDFNTAHADMNATTQFGHTITDMAVDKANVQSVFNTLSGQVDGNDYVYVWWMGHGGGYGVDSCDLSMSISNTGETVTDTEFVSYLSAVASYNKRSVAIMTCHAGGMADNLNIAGSKTVVLTSSTCAESSYERLLSLVCNGLFHADFNYTLATALLEQDPCGTIVLSDYDGNGCVSLSEAHQYNSAEMTTSTPQISDPDAIAATTCIKEDKP